MAKPRRNSEESNEHLKRSFALALNELLNEKGGATSLSEGTGLSLPQISRYSHGQIPSIQTLLDIARWGGVSVDWLLNLQGTKYVANEAIKSEEEAHVKTFRTVIYPFSIHGKIVGEIGDSIHFLKSELAEITDRESSLTVLEIDHRMEDGPYKNKDIIMIESLSNEQPIDTGWHLIDVNNVPCVRLITRETNGLIIKCINKKLTLELTENQMQHILAVYSLGKIVWTSRENQK